MPKGIPFAPPVGPALPISWVGLSAFNTGIGEYTEGMKVTLDGDTVKEGMDPATDYFTWADTTIRNTEEP